MIVPDASAIFEMLTRSELGQRVESRLFGSRISLHAPALIDLEVAQALRRHHRRGAMTVAASRAAIDLLEGLPITRYFHDPLLARIWALRDNVTAYDAAYVALGEALGAPVVTCDGRLAKVKGIQTGVELVK